MARDEKINVVLNRTYRNDALSSEEFSDKYWLKGDAPYQYHTMDIQDGRDEREQLIINDIRALWDFCLRHNVKVSDLSDLRVELSKLQKEVKNLRCLGVNFLVLLITALFFRAKR